MKNIKLAIITILITVFSTGCSSWLDDIAPRNAIPQSALTDSDLEKLLNGLYATMESYVFTYWWADDLQGENFKGGPVAALLQILAIWLPPLPTKPSIFSLSGEVRLLH